MEKLEPLRENLNASLKKTWQEWEIPRESDAKWSDAVTAGVRVVGEFSAQFLPMAT
jgi:hypothetical protein